MNSNKRLILFIPVPPWIVKVKIIIVSLPLPEGDSISTEVFIKASPSQMIYGCPSNFNSKSSASIFYPG